MKTNWIKRTGLLLVAFSFLISPLYSPAVHALGMPTLIAPAWNLITTPDPGHEPPLAIPEFRWSAVAGATSYRLQVARDAAFTASNIILNVTTVNTIYTPTSGAAFTDGTWYWHVRVESPSPVGTYTDFFQFQKQWATDTNNPTLLAPADGATVDFYDNTADPTPTFSWSPVMGASSYRLQIYTSSGGWAHTVSTATTIATTFQPAAKLANGTYFWRVVPVDPGGHDGTASAERSFTQGYNPVLTLLAPDDFVTTAFTPSFRWSAVRGAQTYTLQYATDNTFTTNLTTINTHNTSYTPVSTLLNDKNYYWRVRVASGSSVSAYTAYRTLQQAWHIQPVNLTPIDSYTHVRFPVYNWTPVPGAARYHVDVSTSNGFGSDYDQGDTANTFWTDTKYIGNRIKYYWQVTPYDGDGRKGVTSQYTSFTSEYTEVAPEQVFPLYYYTPDNYPGYPGVTTNSHENRTTAWPIFMWHRLFTPPFDINEGQIFGDAYRLQVRTDQNFGSSTPPDVWDIDTENTVATPNSSNTFVPVPGTTYYWRVRPLSGGIGGTEIGDWSQYWAARFDSSLALTATSGAAPSLVRPADEYEFAESTPLLEWFPLSGASSYDVQISTDSAFASTVDTATVAAPNYAPTASFAQRSLGRLNFGVYYWRVKNSASSTWSATRRFQIASQSQWQFARTPGDASNQLRIGADPAGDTGADPDYDLTDLNASEDGAFWYFGFHVPSSPSHGVHYELYLDTNHYDTGQGKDGGTTDPNLYTITTIPGYRPEYIISIDQVGGVFSKANVSIKAWNWSSWDQKNWSISDGTISLNGNYVELKVPVTLILGKDATVQGSYAVSLLSMASSYAVNPYPQDSVPSDPNISVSVHMPISRFANVTERMNMLTPPNIDGGVDPSSMPSVLPFFWDYPVLAPWAGANMNVYKDPSFTTQIGSYTLVSDTPYYAQVSHAWDNDLNGNNTYYWRIQPRYLNGTTPYLGTWSQGSSFQRTAFIPQNPQVSVTFATPTFSWDMLEGASDYDLSWSTDSGFPSGSTTTINTTDTAYTDLNTLAPGHYYWRVRANRYGTSGESGYTPNQEFTLALPTPTGLKPDTGSIVPGVPTLCWTPLIQNDGSANPVLAAWKYSVQISKDPLFSSSAIVDSTTTEQSCWTPIKGYDDGTYYWHVAMVDGYNKSGAYGPYQTFTKQYLVSTLVSPLSGSSLSATPTFIWTPVDGAASYMFQVSPNTTFSPMTDNKTTNNTRYTPVIKYIPGVTYHWRVAMVDGSGKLGPWNNAYLIINATTRTFTSLAAQDGWVLESAETSSVGGTLNATATTFFVGDDAKRKQYRGILSFSTGATLPDNAVITAVTLKVLQKSIVGGGNPVSALGGFMVDIKNGIFGTVVLEKTDFQVAASKTYGPFVITPAGSWYSITLTAGKAYINKLSTNSGLTQIRLRFNKDDNNNAIANYLNLYSGNAAAAQRPQLVIGYYIP